MPHREKSYSLKKCQKILRQTFSLYKRKKKKLQELQKKRLENLLISLQNAIETKNHSLAERLAKASERIAAEKMPKSMLDKFFDFCGALIFALCVAVVIRQICFEFYIIPTGSMRPTLKEKDYLIVSKTSFSINTLWRTSHYYFDSSLLKRGSVIIFSGAKMDIMGVDTNYFFIFPGKKQYVKRLVGKPGDTLYFYGGQIYGIDKEGNEILDFQDPWFKKIEHIPFIRFEGRVVSSYMPSRSVFSPVVFYQMGQPVARLLYLPSKEVQGELFPFSSTIFPHPSELRHYYELMGMQNFAMASILSDKEASPYHPVEPSPYYLLLMHHPDIYHARLVKDEFERLRPSLNISTSLIPLDEKHLEKILQHLTTTRFVVKNKKAYQANTKNDIFAPYLDVPNGTYEFINGIAYSIHSLGISTKLAPSHPLYRKDPKQIVLLYNFGIEWNNQIIHLGGPSRYVYFRDGDLYIMGNPIFTKEELSLYQVQEESKQMMNPSYKAFIDQQPPLGPDGKLNKELIRKYGFVVPPHMVFALGDCHAISADSRDFGFIPESNLRGRAVWIFWPIERFGYIAQPKLPFFTLPHFVVWGGLIFLSLFSWMWYQHRLKKPLKF